jgi:hypothetical protein
MWGRSTGIICGARSRGRGGSSNPKAKKKISSKHRRIRREKTENFWHHLALALIAWALGMKAALVLEDLQGDEGADWGGEVQEDAAASAQLLVDHEVPPHPGAQGKILRRSVDFRGSAKHVQDVSGMRQGK